MPFEDDPRDFTEEESIEEDAPKRHGWGRWVGIGVAAFVLLFGLISLISALSHRSQEPEQLVDLSALRSTIASEEAELKSLQTEYDTVKQTLDDKQKEYDDARQKLGAGLVDSSAEGQRSLDELKVAADKAQEEYRRYQAQTLSPVEVAYLETVRSLESTAKKKSREKKS